MVMDSSQFSVIWTNKIKRDEKFKLKLIEATQSDFVSRHMSARCLLRRFRMTLRRILGAVLETMKIEMERGELKQTPITS